MGLGGPSPELIAQLTRWCTFCMVRCYALLLTTLSSTLLTSLVSRAPLRPIVTLHCLLLNGVLIIRMHLPFPMAVRLARTVLFVVMVLMLLTSSDARYRLQLLCLLTDVPGVRSCMVLAMLSLVIMYVPCLPTLPTLATLFVLVVSISRLRWMTRHGLATAIVDLRCLATLKSDIITLIRVSLSTEMWEWGAIGPKMTRPLVHFSVPVMQWVILMLKFEHLLPRYMFRLGRLEVMLTDIAGFLGRCTDMLPVLLWESEEL